MRRLLSITLFLVLSVAVLPEAGWAQQDRRELRSGNRNFRKKDYKRAEIDYMKALVKDSTSLSAAYNLGNTLCERGAAADASQRYAQMEESVKGDPLEAAYWYNRGNAAAKGENWQEAVEDYRRSLLLAPDDLAAKENYLYARQKLQEQQQNQDGDGQNDRNQDQNQDRNQDKDQNKDQNKDKDGEQNQQGQNPPQPQPQQQHQQQQISPQAAQQMLQAIQAKEKETMDKVRKEKAAVLKSRQKEKNW